MKKIIHINQHKIKANNKDGGNRPVITVKTYKDNRYCHEVEILGPSKVVYSPDKPLSCGARVWIETQAEVVLSQELYENEVEYSDAHCVYSKEGVLVPL